MTLEQQAIDIIAALPTDKLSYVMSYAKFLLAEEKDSLPHIEEKEFIRQPGILKGQIKMSDDFNETPDCFREYM